MMDNKAFEKGVEQFPWWLDWRDKPVVIMASGPSAGSFPVDRLKNANVGIIAIKTTLDKVPWADVCYGCDAPWWISRRGLPDFKGVRLCHGHKALTQYPTLINRVIISNQDRIEVEKPLHIGSGKNSGFQALNLAIQFGAKKILLVGYDFHGRSGYHWYGRNMAPGMSNPGDLNYRVWVRAMNEVAPWLKSNGIDVINASQHSDIKCFRFGGIEEILTHAAAA